MQRAQRIRCSVELPVPAPEHALIRPGGHHFADEQVVGLLVVGLGQHAAQEPGGAALHQRGRGGRGVAGGAEQFHAMALQLVGLGLGAVGAQGDGQRGQGRSGQLQGELAAGLHQLAGARGLVEHHRDLGRRKVQRAGPGCRHHVVLARVGGRHQHRGAVVEQAVGLVEGDGAGVGRGVGRCGWGMVAMYLIAVGA